MPLKSTRKRRAFTLTEMLMAVTVFSLVLVFSVVILSSTRKVWQKVNASNDAGMVLRKAAFRLSQDLAGAGRDGLATCANGTGSSKMGEALWMLSAEDPAGGRFVRGPGGGAFWQKNVLYYLTVPQDHDARYQMSCQSWDRVCPHKILLRKVIDTGPATTPTSADGDIETLLTEADAVAYMTGPATLDLDPMLSEPGVVSVDLVTTRLLDSDVTLKQAGGHTTEVAFKLESALWEHARNRIAVGRDPFPPNTFTLSRTVGAVPLN